MDFPCVTYTAPVNIAVIKYWGKTDEKLILPTNPSLSVTLGQSELRAKTSVASSPKYKEDRMWLNGKEQPVSSPRIQNVLKEIRRRSKKKSKDSLHRVHICSENDFPTAAGLASSAAGYACLVSALAELYGVHGEISDIARQGSGSACRSMYGGFVGWRTGNHQDSIAFQVAPESHWPEMRSLILVVSDQKKQVGSTEGMQNTLRTSDLMQHRIKLVDSAMDRMTKAIKDKDFPTFAEITMKESNQIHSVCLDTYPPIFYMTDVSRLIIRLVHAINDVLGEVKVCYTFDAGPNACLYLMEEDVPMVLSFVKHFFPSAQNNGEQYVKGIQVPDQDVDKKMLSEINLPISQGSVKYIISTGVGPGPQLVTDQAESLFTEDGKPRL